MKVSQYQTENIFDYSWKEVAIAYWNRYPNPSSAHVLTEDTICREVRDGKLYSRRLLSKTNPVPKWGERFYIKNTPVKILEDSILDPKKKTLITFTRNIGFKKIMSVDEVVEYVEVADGRTCAVRRAYVTSQVFGFSRAIRAFGIERFKNNCHKAANGFNYVLRNMFPHHQQQHAAAVMAATSATGTFKAIADAKSDAYRTTTTTTTTVSATTVSTPVTANVTQSSKSEIFKNAAKSTFNFIKNNTAKLAQLFSIKN